VVIDGGSDHRRSFGGRPVVGDGELGRWAGPEGQMTPERGGGGAAAKNEGEADQWATWHTVDKVSQ
jgi:hypothetical protein